MKKQLILVLLIFSHVVFGQLDLTHGLVGYFPFHGDANDYSGNNNNGTIVGNALLAEDRFGNENSAYYFDGEDDQIIIESTEEISFSSLSDSYSVAFWSKADSNYFNVCRVIEKWDESLLTSTPLSIQAGKSSCKIVLYEKTNSQSIINHVYNLWDDNWHFIVVAIDGQSKEIRTYFDNELTDKEHIGFEVSNENNVPWTIGGNYSYYGSRLFKGYLDDVRFYNKILSSEEIEYLYNDAFDITKVEDLTNEIKIYPNPTKGIVNIDIENYSACLAELEMRVFNACGNIIYKSTLNNEYCQIDMGNSGEPGVYLIQIIDNSGNIIEARKVVLL